jgi:DNA-binding LytR/AlgR family response regulator
MSIPCFIIEDEEPAVELLRFFVQQQPALQWAGYAHQNIDIPAAVLNGSHLLFLDIEMPFRNGLDFLRQLPAPLPVILTTSYSQYALDGFNLAVIDYLLKPFAKERFAEAVQKAMDYFTLRAAKANTADSAFVMVKDNYQEVKIMARDILYIEGWKQYIKIHTTGKMFMVIDSLKRMEEALAAHLLRCHKSFLVNRHHITSYNQSLIQIGDQKIPVGKMYKAVVAGL